MNLLSIPRSAALKAFALALLLPGFFCSAGRAQTMETITNSLKAYEALLANMSPTQQVVYVGDMGFRPAYLSAWVSQLKAMAGLSGVAPHSAFDARVAVWPGGVVPYTYDSSMTPALVSQFEGAIYMWQKVANLKFIQHTSEANYIVVTNSGAGGPANSMVGMFGGAQLININAGYPQLDFAHELGHALGMIHEQSRSDRDTYVKIHWENFTAASLTNGAALVNFGILTNSINFGAYDYDSIMEYPAHDGNTGRVPGDPVCSDSSCTQIEPLPPYYSAQGSPPLGQTTHLSAGDLAAMAGEYGLPRVISGHVVNGPGGAFAGVTVSIAGGVSYRGPAAVTTDANGNYSFIGIPNNSGTFTVTASLAGHSFNPGGWNITVGTTDSTTANFSDADTSPPTVTIVSPTNTSYKVAPMASGTAADNNGPADTGVAQVNVVMYRTSDAVWWNFHDHTWGTTNFNAFYNLTVATGTTAWSAALPASLADGGYQVQAQAVDNAANASGWVTRNFTIDTTAPTITFAPLTNQQVVFNFNQLGGTISKASTVQFKIEWFQAGGNMFWNGANWTSVESDPGVLLPANLSGLNWTPAPGTLPPRLQLAQANYVIYVYATDTAGNVGYNNIVLTRSPLDTTPPIVTLDTILNGAVLTNQYLPGLSGSALDYESGVTSVQVHLYRFSGGSPLYWDGSSWNANPATVSVTYNPQTAAWQVNAALPSGANLPNGGYGVEVYAVNGEAPPLNKDLIVTFSVDYHPVFTWTAGSYYDLDPNNNNNEWNNALNWDALAVPGTNAIVIINSAPTGTPHATGTNTVYELRLLGAPLSCDALVLNKRLVQQGDLSANRVTFPAGSSWEWSSGVASGIQDIQPGASALFSAVASKTLADNSLVLNRGTITWSNSSPLVANGYSGFSTISNLPAATFQIIGDGQVFSRANGYYSIYFVNDGVFSKLSGSGSSSVDTCQFVNDGEVHADTGTLDFNATVQLNQGGQFTGAALTRFTGGQFTLSGTSLVQNATLELDGGNFIGAGDNSGTFATAGTGLLVWAGGIIYNTLNLATNAQAQISGAGTKYLADGARLDSRGQVTWSDGTLMASGYSAQSFIRNRAGATFTVTGTNVAARANGYYLGQFENQPGGLLGFNLSGLSPWTGWELINNGVVRGDAGTLQLQTGGASSGVYSNLPGAELRFTGGTFALHAGTTFIGGGTTRVAGGSLIADGYTTAGATSSSGRFVLDSGVVGGNGFTSLGQFQWNSGMISGTFSNAPGAMLELNSDGTAQLDNNAVFNNLGTAQFIGSGWMQVVGYSGPSIWNNLPGALFEVKTNGTLFGQANGYYALTFNNSMGARLAKTAGTNSLITTCIYNNSGELRCDTGTLVFNAPLNLNDGTTFTGAGQHQLAGNATSLSGAATVQASTLNLTGATLTGANTNASITATNGAVFNWSGGTIAGTVTLTPGSLLQLTGAGDKYLADGAVFNNNANVQDTGAGRLVANGYSAPSYWNNLSGAHFDLPGDGQVFSQNSGYYVLIFTNYPGARLAKTAGTNSSIDTCTFNNSGELRCDTGSLRFNTTLNLNPGTLFVGMGQHQITGGNVTLAGASTVQNTTLAFSGGSFIGTDTNATVVTTGSGLWNWSGGTVVNTMNLAPGSLLQLTGAGDKYLADGAVFNNNANVQDTGSGRLVANGYSAPSYWNNRPGAHFDLLGDGQVFSQNSGYYFLIFTNSPGARVAKTAGTNSLIDTCNLNNSGELRCDTGLLRFNAALNLNDGGTFTGAGNHEIIGGSVTLTGTSTAQSTTLAMSGGNLIGGAGGTLATASGGLFDWRGGTWFNTVNFAAGGSFRFSSAAAKAMADGATLNNAGTLTLAGSGPLQISGYSDTSTLNNQSGGVIQVVSNATWGRFSGYYAGTFINSGVIAMTNNARLFQTDWNYTQNASGSMNLLLAGPAPAGGYSQFAVNSANLNGALNVFLGAGFIPAATNQFDVLLYGNRTGQFAPLSLPPLAAGLSWASTYGASALTLSLGQQTFLAGPTFTNGQFQFTLNGAAGSSAVLEASTNLVNWMPCLTNTPFNGTLNYVDPQTAQFSERFYRATIFP